MTLSSVLKSHAPEAMAQAASEWAPPVQILGVQLDGGQSAQPSSARITHLSNGGQALPELLADASVNHVLIVHGGPAQLLGDSVERGFAPEKAMQAWEQGIHTLLTAWRKARHRVSFVAQAVIQSSDHPKRALLAQHLELPLDVLDDALGAIDPASFPEGPSSLSQLVAAGLLEADISLRETADEIQAATLGSAETFLDATQIVSALDEHTRQNAEADLLREALSLAEKKAEQLADAKEQKDSAQDASLKQAVQAQSVLRQEVAALRDALQLSQVQSEQDKAAFTTEAGSYQKRLSEAQEQLKNLSQDLAITRSELDHAQAATTTQKQKATRFQNEMSAQHVASNQTLKKMQTEIAAHAQTVQRLENERSTQNETLAAQADRAAKLDQEITLLRTALDIETQRGNAASLDAGHLQEKLAMLSETSSEHHVLKAVNETFQRELLEAAEVHALRSSVFGAQILALSAQVADLQAGDAHAKAEASARPLRRFWKRARNP